MPDEIRVFNVEIEGYPTNTNLRTIEVSEDLRPQIGDQIKLADFPTEVFKIIDTRGVLSSPDFTYIVMRQSDIDITAGGSVPTFPDYYLRSLNRGSAGGDGYLFRKKRV